MPSLITQNAICNGSSCMSGGLPANWIVVYHNPGVSNSIN